MIPKINLDDRTFDDIFNDCLKLIPRYCPEWTNHNTSDPGIALLELFSWMTEMTIYRLNKVPEKTYLSLLELMGLSLITPQSSRAIVQFLPVEGVRRDIDVKAGTKIAASVSDSEDIVFQTEKNIKVKNLHLKSCVNRFKEVTTENVVNGTLKEFSLFESKNSVEHVLYLKSESFKYLTFEHFVRVELTPVKEIVKESDQFVKHVFWEYWDGEQWNMLKVTSSINNLREKNNVIYIHGNIPIQQTTVMEDEGFWVRAILSDVPEEKSILSVKDVKLKTVFGGKGFSPDFCLTKNNNAYSIVDMNSSFKLFSETPEYNEAFYLSADEILKNKNGKIEISYFFNESNVNVEENKNAVFAYEYWNGADWVKIPEENEFVDGTFNLKQQGTVSFIIPKDLSLIDVNNEEHFWIRVRLLTKDFATGGVYVKDDKDNWGWKFTSKVQTPEIDKIRIKYESTNQSPEDCITYSNFNWKNLKELVKNDGASEVCLFNLDENDSPSLYFGFDDKFPAGESSLYFKIDENIVEKSRNKFDDFHIDSLTHKKSNNPINLLWEYFNGTEWKRLTVSDNTNSFYESGFLDFVVPEDMASENLFGNNLYWVRVSLVSGSFENVPYVKDVLLNSVYVKNEKTYENEIIGSGTGAPGQSCSVAHTNILKGSELYVNEGSIPSANEIEKIRRDVKGEPYFVEGDKVWVRYTEVENFYSSNAFSRHYVVDYSTGKIQFGDGTKGLNPPKGKFNIMMKSYHAGGGSIGNVAKNTIQILLQGIPFISGCTNPFPAEGGADMEKIDNLKSRAAGAFKSLQRAVTAEDFQWLARESSASVGRSYCLKERNSKNEVCTVIVPVRPRGFSYTEKLIPSRELIRRVKEYLDERKIVGTAICVQGPIYRDFDISMALTFKSNVLDEGLLKQKIDKRLREYFDCLEGDEGSGWTFGKEITVGSVLKQLEKIEGILSVNNVEVFDLDANVNVEKILIKNSELPFLRNVIIEKR